MTSLERYRNALHGQHFDHAPRTPIVMRLAAEAIGHNYGEFVSDYRILVEANLYCAKTFGFDQVSVISDPYRETSALGGEVRIAPTGPKCKPLMGDEIDLSLLQTPDLETSMRTKDRLDAIRLYQQTVGGEMSILGWVEGAAAQAGDLRGVENFLVDLLEEPEDAESLMDACLEVEIAFARAQVAAGADTIGIGDALVSQVSPALYNELILPRQQRLVEAIRSMGAYVRMHICGNISHLLPGLAKLKLDAMDVDHMVDLALVRATVGPDVLVGANLDPVKDVLEGTPDGIHRKLLEARRVLGARFANNAGCEIPPGSPEQNLRALCSPVSL